MRDRHRTGQKPKMLDHWSDQESASKQDHLPDLASGSAQGSQPAPEVTGGRDAPPTTPAQHDQARQADDPARPTHRGT